MKKIFSTLMALVLSITIGLPAFANQTAISDKKVKDMYRDAAIQNQVNKSVYATAVNERGHKFKLKAYKYGNTIKTGENEYTETYVMSSEKADEADDSSVDKQGLARTLFSDDDWDDSLSVHAYMTMTYTNSGGYYKLTNVTGQWVIADSTVTISNRKVTYTCNHITLAPNQTTVKNPTGNSFNYNTGYTNSITNTPTGILGMNMEVKCKHASSTWTFNFVRTIFNNGVDF